MFMRDVFRCGIDLGLFASFYLVELVYYGRQVSLFQVSYARVCTVRDGLFTIEPRLTANMLGLLHFLTCVFLWFYHIQLLSVYKQLTTILLVITP